MDQMLRLRIVLRETNIGEYYEYAASVSDPKGAAYGQYLKRTARSGPQADLKARFDKVAAIFQGAARVVPVRDSASGSLYSPLLFVDGTEAYLDQFFEGKTLDRFLDDVSGGSQINPWEWDGALVSARAPHSKHSYRALWRPEAGEHADAAAHSCPQPASSWCVHFRSEQGQSRRRRSLRHRPGAATRRRRDAANDSRLLRLSRPLHVPRIRPSPSCRLARPNLDRLCWRICKHSGLPWERANRRSNS